MDHRWRACRNEGPHLGLVTQAHFVKDQKALNFGVVLHSIAVFIFSRGIFLFTRHYIFGHRLLRRTACTFRFYGDIYAKPLTIKSFIFCIKIQPPFNNMKRVTNEII